MDKNKFINELKKFKNNIKDHQKVDKMILFGSRARGDYNKNSDVDIIIVGDFKNKKNLYRAPKLHMKWHLDLPIDLICLNKKEYVSLKNKISIISTAVKEGIEI